MPSGLPDTDALSALGGILYDYAPVEDPTIEESAVFRNRYVNNISAMTATACRAWCAFVGNAGSPTDPASNVHGAVWGSTVGVKPTVARTGTGVYTVTWTSTQSDGLNVSHTLALRRVWCSAGISTATLFHPACSVTSANVVTLRVYDSSGGSSNGAGETFTVYVL